MTAIGARKELALSQKISALAAEFDHWVTVTEANKEFEKHQTQVRALTGHLSGLWRETQAMFEQTRKDGTVLADARNIESLVLGLRRIWEFFRSKLVQRRDPDLRQFLQAADELAWACYKPILDRCGGPRREPPLVFLNGGLSPYALSRDRAFPAEDVPGEPLASQTYEPILERLPIPVIGVPWYQVAHLPDLPVVAHETGHAVEQDFGLHGLVLANLKQRLGAQSAHLQHWTQWSREVFADLWGCLTLGPAYVSSLAEFLATNRTEIVNEIVTPGGRYPTAYLRVLLCAKALGLMGFGEVATTIESDWRTEYPGYEKQDFEDDLEPVARAMLATRLERPGLVAPLLDIAELRFSADDWRWAKMGADEQDREQPPETANTIARWVAAARELYERSPERYVTKKRGASLLAYAKTLIQPGTRAGETAMDLAGKERLSSESRTSGGEWFEAFSKWANVKPR